MRSDSLIWSRCANTLSSEMSPTTERSVVAAMFCAAPEKFSTWTTLACASTTLKNVMKSIEIGALSLVIAVCFTISR